jgi:hypothetical protein
MQQAIYCELLINELESPLRNDIFIEDVIFYVINFIVSKLRKVVKGGKKLNINRSLNCRM